MGRKKVDIRPIPEGRKRQVTFMKRKSGLLKKAMELSILCQCDMAVVIFNHNGKLYDYGSNDIHKTIRRFRRGGRNAPGNSSGSGNDNTSNSKKLAQSPREHTGGNGERSDDGSPGDRSHTSTDDTDDDDEDEDESMDEYGMPSPSPRSRGRGRSVFRGGASSSASNQSRRGPSAACSPRIAPYNDGSSGYHVDSGNGSTVIMLGHDHSPASGSGQVGGGGMRRSGSGSSLGLTLSASNFGPALPVIQDYSPPGLLGARGARRGSGGVVVHKVQRSAAVVAAQGREEAIISKIRAMQERQQVPSPKRRSGCRKSGPNEKESGSKQSGKQPRQPKYDHPAEAAAAQIKAAAAAKSAAAAKPATVQETPTT